MQYHEKSTNEMYIASRLSTFEVWTNDYTSNSSSKHKSYFPDDIYIGLPPQKQVSWVSIDNCILQLSRDVISLSWSVPSHFLNHCWNIVNWTLANKIQRNLNRNLHIFTQENVIQNVFRKFAAILSRQCVFKWKCYKMYWFDSEFTMILQVVFRWNIQSTEINIYSV